MYNFLKMTTFIKQAIIMNKYFNYLCIYSTLSMFEITHCLYYNLKNYVGSSNFDVGVPYKNSCQTCDYLETTNMADVTKAQKLAAARKKVLILIN